MEWMLMPLRRYADFSGRSRRMEYWMFQLLNILVLIIPLGLVFSSVPWDALQDPEAAAMASPGALAYVGMALIGLWCLFVIIPGIAVTVRRLHDRDMSGWWYLGFIVLGAIPFIGWIASIAFLVILVLPGTSGPNRFGDDPLDDGYKADVFA